MGIFNKKDEAPQDDEGQDVEALKKASNEQDKAAALARMRLAAAEGEPVAIMTLAHIEAHPEFLDQMFDENGDPRPEAAIEMLAQTDPGLIAELIANETGHAVPESVVKELVQNMLELKKAEIDEIRENVKDEIHGTGGDAIDRTIDEILADKKSMDPDEVDEMAESSGFASAWASFSEAMGADVKLVKTGPDEGEDEVVITLPSGAALMFMIAIEAGLAAVHEQRPLSFIKKDIKLRHVERMHAGRPFPLEQALYALSLLSGRLAFKKAKHEYDEVDEGLDFDVADAIEEGVDAKWRSAIDEGGAPVETPHDLTNYLKWLNGEKERLEAALAEVTGNGTGEES